MGILNVTPDSFSDGGLHASAEGGLAQAMRLIGDGADILDIGGESTRPGAGPVPADEEIARTIPVIEAVHARWHGPISIDTMKPDSPSIISGLRPCLSEARAHPGDEAAQRSADREKMAETIASGMPIERPIAGSTEISPVFPMAVAMETAKMIAKDRRGSAPAAEVAMPSA